VADSDDNVEIRGLASILDEGEEPPFLDLTLRCDGQEYRAAVLAVEDSWAVRVSDDWGHSCSEEADLYATQADAILIAMLIALDHSRAHAHAVAHSPVLPSIL
jgi:hypothetical protein